MPITPASNKLKLAYFKPLGGPDKDKPFEVHFNPSSLQYSLSNTMDKKDPKNKKSVQIISASAAKLTMDLVYDTTTTGADVRVETNKIATLLSPDADKMKPGADRIPPRVEFGWGTYSFKGVVEQYKETLEFFSSDGVPLRASINLTLADNEFVFKSSKHPESRTDTQINPEPFEVRNSSGPSSIANAVGDPRAARAIASLSASASLRFDGDATLVVSSRVTLLPPVAFAAAGGGDISVRGGLIASGDFGGRLNSSIDSGQRVFATAGAAFGGLRASPTTAGIGSSINIDSLLPPRIDASNGTAGFTLGGAARLQQGGSLSADVGASSDLSARITFSD